MMKISLWKISGFAAWVALGMSAFAQAPTPEAEQPKAGTAFVRCFADLGERQGKLTYTLSCTSPQGSKPGAPPAIIFDKVNGGRSSNVGFGAMPFAAGAYTFTLAADTGGGSDRVSGNLEPDGIYTLLAVLDGQRPVLRLIREYPIADAKNPESPIIKQPGIVVHNLKADVPLVIQVGDTSPVIVPFSKEQSFFLSGGQITGPVVAEYPSERKSARRRQIAYESGSRLVAVFLRNGYGTPSIVTFPAEPDKPDEEQPQ